MKSHPYMERYLQEIINTLKKPDRLDRKLYLKGYYYKHFKYLKNPNRFILVIIRYSNGKGFVITSYLTDKIK